MNLHERMKEYEYVTRTYLTRRTPAIIRVDGRAFHSFTKGLKKPFDYVLCNAMQETMKELCRSIQGCVLGYTQSDEISLMAPQGEERPSAEENHLDLRGVFDPEEEISFLFDDNPAPSDEAPAPEEAEDFELIDAAIVSDAGYFAVTYDANSNSGTFAFALETQGDRRFHESTVEECKNIEQATFEGAAALLEEIKNSGYTSIIIHMDKESCALLRRNAIYGIVDEYRESCIKYIQKAKEIVLKCHIRLTDETWTTEQIVTQSLVEGMAKKAIK